MGQMARFYEDIAGQAGLDVCEASTLDSVADAIQEARDGGAVALIDIFDAAVDALIVRHYPWLMRHAEAVSA